MKYIKSFIIISILFLFSIVDCYAEEAKSVVSKDKGIFDYADLYTSSEEEKLEKKIQKYRKSTKMDAIVLTLEDFNGDSVGDYARSFYNTYGFRKNGVIFAIYTKNAEPEIYMFSMGDESIKYYGEARVGEILKYVYKNIATKEYYKATDNYITIIQGFYDLDTKSDDYYLNENGKLVKVIPWIEIVILALALTFIFIVVFLYKLRSSSKSGLGNQLDIKLNKNNLVLITEKDELVDTTIEK